MHRSTSRLIPVSLVLALVVCVGLAPLAFAQETVKIGVLLPLTGRYADFGEQMKSGIELAISHGTQDGTLDLNGTAYNVQVIWANSEGKLEVALPAVQKLITVDKIDVATGFFYSSIFLGIMDEFERYGIPAVDTVGAATAIFDKIAQDKMEYIFQLSPTVDNMGSSTAAATNHYLQPERIALLSEDSDSGREINRYAIEWFAEYAPAVEVVFNEFTDAETVDFSVELLKIKAADADVQFSLILGASSGPMLEQRADLGLETALSHFGGTVDAESFRTEYADLMEGMLVNVRFWPGEYTPLSLRMYQDYEAAYGTTPTTFAVQAYEGALVLLEAMKAAGSVDPVFIKSELESGTFTGIRGPIAFSSLADGHRLPAQMAICQVQNGELIPVWPLSIAAPDAYK